MLRTKTVLAAGAAALVVAAVGSLGAAQADTTGASGTTGATGSNAVSPATITVNGAGFVTADASASQATFQADYLTALGNALSDAKTKATMLATQSGDTLGVVQNITEQSNDNGGCAPLMFAAGTAKSAPAGAPAPKKHRKHHAALRAIPIARAADNTNTSCTIGADVTVTYAMSAS
jgi:hypothetical protein